MGAVHLEHFLSISVSFMCFWHGLIEEQQLVVLEIEEEKRNEDPF